MDVCADLLGGIAVIPVKMSTNQGNALLHLLLRRQLSQSFSDILAFLFGCPHIFWNRFTLLLKINPVHFAGGQFKADLCILPAERKPLRQIFRLQQLILPAKQIGRTLEEKLRNTQSRRFRNKLRLHSVLVQHFSQFPAPKAGIAAVFHLCIVVICLTLCILEHIANRSVRLPCFVLQCLFYCRCINIVKRICLCGRSISAKFHLLCFVPLGCGNWSRCLPYPEILPTKSSHVQAADDTVQGISEIIGAGQHIGGI